VHDYTTGGEFVGERPAYMPTSALQIHDPWLVYWQSSDIPLLPDFITDLPVEASHGWWDPAENRSSVDEDDSEGLPVYGIALIAVSLPLFGVVFTLFWYCCRPKLDSQGRYMTRWRHFREKDRNRQSTNAIATHLDRRQAASQSSHNTQVGNSLQQDVHAGPEDDEQHHGLGMNGDDGAPHVAELDSHGRDLPAREPTPPPPYLGEGSH
jgi:hypothetical protein